MNKIKASKKDMRKNYRILSVGASVLHNLLAYRIPVAYSANPYGWACDYYDVYGVIICTGYDPIKSKNVSFDYDTIRKYEDMASKENTREGVEGVLKAFIEEVTK